MAIKRTRAKRDLHLTVPIKSYLTSEQADTLRERRLAQGMSEAAFVRYAVCVELGFIKKGT